MRIVSHKRLKDSYWRKSTHEGIYKNEIETG